MMAALARQSMRLCLASRPRAVLAFVALAYPLAEQCLAASSTTVRGNEPWVAMILVSGACSTDARSGFQRSVLSRPITRFQYLSARWLGGLCVAGGLMTAQLLLSFAAAAALGVDGAPGAPVLAASLADVLVTSALLTAYLIVASAMLPGVGDLVLYAVMVVALQAARELLPESAMLVGMLAGIPMSFLRGTDLALASPVAWAIVHASNVAALLGLGAVLFNRRTIPAEARS